MTNLLDKLFIITGAASGIGHKAAQCFASRGAIVALLDINSDGLADTKKGIKADDGSVFTYSLDLTDADQVEQTIQNIIQQHGRIDGLFNVVGGSGRRRGDGPIDECTLEGWEFTLNLNLTSMFFMCKYTIPHLTEGGSITNLSSVLGMTGNVQFATHAYAASKGAIISMSRAMAVYYADQGIRINVIAPGLVRTGMSERAEDNEAINSMMKRLQPLTGAIGEADAVANVAAFVASDDARFVTGVVIPVDGGWTAQ